MTLPIEKTETPVLILRSVHHGGLAIARSLGRLGVPVYVLDSNSHAPSFSSRSYRGNIWRKRTVHENLSPGHRQARQAGPEIARLQGHHGAQISGSGPVFQFFRSVMSYAIGDRGFRNVGTWQYGRCCRHDLTIAERERQVEVVSLFKNKLEVRDLTGSSQIVDTSADQAIRRAGAHAPQ